LTRYLEQANECTDPTTGDYLWIYDANAGATDKDRKVNVNKFAVLANTQTFTAAQTFTGGVGASQPATSTSAIAVTPLASMSVAPLAVSNIDNGSSFGPFVSIGRNSNGSTPAAGFIRLTGKTGNSNDIWADSSATPGVLRIGNGTTTTTDTAGSIVGSQSSWVEFKEDITPWNDNHAALDAVLACKLFGYRFKGDESRRQYHGLIIHEEDRGAWFSENDGEHQVPALNERNLFGHLIAAIQAQQAEIVALRAEIEALKNA